MAQTLMAIAAGKPTLVDIPLLVNSYLQGITQIKEETKTNRGINLLKKSQQQQLLMLPEGYTNMGKKSRNR